MTDDEIKENQKLIDNECKKIVSTIPKDASDFEKTLIVHDYITSHYEYDTSYQIRTLPDTVKEKKMRMSRIFIFIYAYYEQLP